MRFDFKGAYDTFIAKANKKYVFDLLGASGCWGGAGGHVQAIYTNTSDTTLYLYVGGSPEGDGFRLGGWNGGGAGGTGYVNEGWDRSGGGGGGATDVRTSTSLSNRILVAGGGGGGAGGGIGGQYPFNTDGDPYPPRVDGNGTWCCGGAKGTLTAGGVGGVAPSIRGTVDADNDGTYYVDCGGGGGGGYYGGGGGSTGVVNGKRGTSFSGVAGSSGGSGIGGAGGSRTTGTSGYGAEPAGGGGGGSSYIATNAQLSYGTYDQYYNMGNGYILVHEVVSAPKIMGAWKDGDKIYLKIFKEELEGNKEIEEIFYYSFSLDRNSDEILKSPSKAVIVSNKEMVVSYTIDNKTTSGFHQVYITVTSADDKVDTITVPFVWNDIEPTLEFNYSVLNKTLIQGRHVANAFSATGLLSGDIPLIYESKLIIDGQEFDNIQKSPSTSIFLPCIYDGLHTTDYKLKVKVRVGQMATGIYGTGKEIWSRWFESNELTVYAPIIPLNKVEFKNSFSDRAVEKDTKLKISWGLVDGYMYNTSKDFEYIISLFKDSELLLEEKVGQQTEMDMIMGFPQGDGYKFGISILEKGEFLSEMNFSETFQIANITTGGKVTLSENLDLVTNVTDSFNKIEILINGAVDLTEKTNVNTRIPIWKLKSGNNSIEVKVYVTEAIYVKHSFKVYLHALVENVQNVNTHTIDISVSVDNEENFINVPSTSEPVVVKLGEVEREFESLIEAKIVQDMTQKITIKKINNEVNHDLKIVEIIGGLG